METKAAKKVGEPFELLTNENGPELNAGLFEVAWAATRAENELWMLWRKHDPVSSLDLVSMEQAKKETGKWPKLPDYNLKNVAEGPTPCKIAGALCPELYSYVYDAVANRVAKLYRKRRFKILTFQERLPMAREPRIRFRERAAVIRRHPANRNWFQVGLALRRRETWWFGLKPRGSSAHTREWLSELADSGEHPSGGSISRKRRKGKKIWQITFARTRREDERRQVKRPVAARWLVVWAPLDQKVFLSGQVEPVNGRPWLCSMETNDLNRVKRRYDEDRRSMGHNYRQSPHSAAHGHGRQRALAGKRRFRQRLENRFKDWIENRSTDLVQTAVRMRCAGIRIEHLSNRDPEKLCLGHFPYYRLLDRIKDKAADAGLKFELMKDLETVASYITGGQQSASD